MHSTPIDPPYVRYVHSFEELISTPMCDEFNALCLRRTIEGDFSEVIRHLKAERGITTLERARLLSLPVSAAGKVAIDFMLRDQEQL